MVFVHGATILAREIPNINFVTWKFMDFSIFRGFASLCLPLFAGFFIRQEIGPYIKNHRIPGHFFVRGLEFFMIAVTIEALRLTTVLLSPAFMFNWHALQFISVAMLIVYGLAYVDERLVALFTFLTLTLRYPLQNFFHDYDLNGAALTVSESQNTAIAWAASLGGVTFWLLVKVIRPNLRLDFSSSRISLVAAALISLVLSCFGYQYILEHQRSLNSFANLPYSIFFPSLKDDNYWSMFVCFPIFAAGYFARSILFSAKNIRYGVWINAVAVISAVHFLTYRVTEFESKVSEKAAFSKAMFAVDSSMILGFLSVSYLGFVFLYYYCRSRPTPWLDKLTYYSRSVLVIYIVHGIVFVIVRVSVPFSIIQKITPFEGILFVYLVIHICYVASLYLSHQITKILERRRAVEI